MGIKHFFIWFKNQFSEDIHKVKQTEFLKDKNIDIDNLMIDMNGIFHTSAQKIYEYGNYQTPPRLLQNRSSNKNRQNTLHLQLKMFEDVCNTIDLILNIVKPNKKLILCVDGPAPISKQNQQRQRRFRSAAESNNSCLFDSNNITPGTKFMDFLTKYIDWYIRKKIHQDELWKNIQVIFSNEKAPGEGEHKIINYIRFYGNREDTYCIHGLDADLIMLALGTHLPNFYILREDMYDAANDYFCVDVGKIHDKLSNVMKWESDNYDFNIKSSIDDFIFMCFMVGNDFLPHIPSIEIIEAGIELMIDIYKQVCTSYGHLTINTNDRIRFIPKTVGMFMQTIGFNEKANFENKLSKKACFFPDPLLEKCSIQNENKWTVDIEKYKDYYCSTKITEENIEKVCHDYLEGMQWVLSYYTRGVPHWKWHYTEHYAPPASILSQYVDTFKFPTYPVTNPSTPFQQLLCVLPPKNANLIPKPLSNLLTNEVSPIKKHCPEIIEIDLAGKRKEWEGIVLLPMVDFNLVRREYMKIIDQVSVLELKRNIIGRSFLYEKVHKYPYLFKSYYGNIENCTIKTTLIDL